MSELLEGLGWFCLLAGVALVLWVIDGCKAFWRKDKDGE